MQNLGDILATDYRSALSLLFLNRLSRNRFLLGIPQEKIRLERERQTTNGVTGKAEMLEEMALTFYADLRQRMESFFRDDGKRTPVTARG